MFQHTSTHHLTFLILHHNLLNMSYFTHLNMVLMEDNNPHIKVNLLYLSLYFLSNLRDIIQHIYHHIRIGFPHKLSNDQHQNNRSHTLYCYKVNICNRGLNNTLLGIMSHNYKFILLYYNKKIYFLNKLCTHQHYFNMLNMLNHITRISSRA